MHQASDGMLARVRLPGGRVTGVQLRTLADCARQFGNGVLYLTSRGNLQLRGMSQCAGSLGDALGAAGLLPSISHERVRNYLASPASGCFGGYLDVSWMLRALDEAVRTRARLAELSGRFLFALDDGRGDVVSAGADLCWQAVESAGGSSPGRLIVAGVDSGLRVDACAAVDVLVRCAEAFVAANDGNGHGTWRVRDMPGARELLTNTVRAAGIATHAAPEELETGVSTPLGTTSQDDGRVSICVAPPLGELSDEQARLVASVSNEVVVTHTRTVLVRDVDPCEAEDVSRAMAHVGIDVDSDATVSGVSACIGAPSCAKAYADVRTHARALLNELPTETVAHFAGCERRCGKPPHPHTDVLAGHDGYRVDGVWVSTDALAESVARPYRAKGTK